MRDNLFEGDCNITKKLYSYAKTKSNSSRIPEVIHRQETYRSDPSEQAELFNNYFCDQFSSPSTYDVPIDVNGPDRFDIVFHPSTVERLLSNLNTNKAIGPDGVHGNVLKNCASSLSIPLSNLFNFKLKVPYCTCTLPSAICLPARRPPLAPRGASGGRRVGKFIRTHVVACGFASLGGHCSPSRVSHMFI